MATLLPDVGYPNNLDPRQQIRIEDLDSITRAPLPWNRFDGATVMISGAGGFLGSHLAETLLHRNELAGVARTQVIGLVRDAARAEVRFARYAGRTDLQLLVQDVTTPVSHPGPVDFVIHAASNASPVHYSKDPVGTHLANTLGTYNLLRLATERSCKAFLFISSGDVYGDISRDNQLISEETFGALDPVLIRSCYGESKRAGENLCACWIRQYGLSTGIARLSHTYGPGIALDDGRVFADFVACALAGRDIVLTSDGTARRPFCYVTDAVIGLFTILLLGGPGQAYNLANDEATISIAELAGIVANCVPQHGIKPVFDLAARPADYLPSPLPGGLVDTRKLRSLGWRPTIPPQLGFSRMIRSY